MVHPVPPPPWSYLKRQGPGQRVQGKRGGRDETRGWPGLKKAPIGEKNDAASGKEPADCLTERLPLGTRNLYRLSYTPESIPTSGWRERRMLCRKNGRSKLKVEKCTPSVKVGNVSGAGGELKSYVDRPAGGIMCRSGPLTSGKKRKSNTWGLREGPT